MNLYEAIEIICDNYCKYPDIENGDKLADICDKCPMNRCEDLRWADHKTEQIEREGEWISCSERLPENSGDYLVCPSDSVLEDYSDFSEVMIMPYDADCEAFGWWTERYDPISLGYLDSDFNEFDVLAWMSLPKPWKG